MSIHIRAFARIKTDTKYVNLSVNADDPHLDEMIRLYCEVNELGTPEFYSIATVGDDGEWEATPRIYLKQ